MEKQEGNKRVHHQQIAPFCKYEALQCVSATFHSHLQEVSVLKDTYSIIVQMVHNIYQNVNMQLKQQCIVLY